MREILAVMAVGMASSMAFGSAVSSLSFQVNEADYDTNMDGFITGTELTLTGSSGAVFEFTPINNLVGMPRLFVNEDRGLHFGGGGGSTLEMSFVVDTDIMLYQYTIADMGFILGNPTFDMKDGMTVLSSTNDADSPGPYAFNGGTMNLTAGTPYTMLVTSPGAGIQSFMASWEYDEVPTPGAAGLIGLAGLAAMRRRR